MLTKNIADYTNKRIEECTDLELFNAVLNMSADLIKENGYNEGKKNYFKSNFPTLVARILQRVATEEQFKKIHYVVVDTVNNLMVSEEMRRAKEKG